MIGYPAKLIPNTSRYDSTDQVFYFINNIHSHFAIPILFCNAKSTDFESTQMSIFASSFKQVRHSFVGEEKGVPATADWCILVSQYSSVTCLFL